MTNAEKSARYRAKDVEAYRKKKREYARTPEERAKRMEYMRQWRAVPENRKKHNAWAREYHRRKYPERRQILREGVLRKKYGIGQMEYDAILASQNGQCGMCLKPYTSTKDFHVDHDHSTGKIRGILCFKCNTNLGWFETRRTAIFRYLGES